MGFLRRLFGGPAAAPSSAPKAGLQHYTVVTFDDTRDDAVVEVVGEQYYPESVQAFRTSKLPQGRTVVLMPEPTNQRDRNAIMVLVWTVEGEMAPIGHLPSEQARAYRPFFDHLDGKLIQCEAAISFGRGGAGTDGIVLHLGTPGELMAEYWAAQHPLRTDHPWFGQTVSFTGAGTELAGTFLGREAQLLLARKAGCTAVPRVTKKVHVCVAANPREVTGNAAKALEYGIPIVAERDFWIGVGVDEVALGASGQWAQPARSGYR